MREVRENEDALDRCVQRERMSNPGVTGRIESQLSIGPDGRVIRATVARSSVPNPAIEQCVTSALRMMAFPAPESGQIEVVRLPWNFGP